MIKKLILEIKHDLDKGTKRLFILINLVNFLNEFSRIDKYLSIKKD